MSSGLCMQESDTESEGVYSISQAQDEELYSYAYSADAYQTSIDGDYSIGDESFNLQVLEEEKRSFADLSLPSLHSGLDGGDDPIRADEDNDDDSFFRQGQNAIKRIWLEFGPMTGLQGHPGRENQLPKSSEINAPSSTPKTSKCTTKHRCAMFSSNTDNVLATTSSSEEDEYDMEYSSAGNFDHVFPDLAEGYVAEGDDNHHKSAPANRNGRSHHRRRRCLYTFITAVLFAIVGGGLAAWLLDFRDSNSPANDQAEPGDTEDMKEDAQEKPASEYVFTEDSCTERLAASCQEHYEAGCKNDGLYWVQPTTSGGNIVAPFQVYCDQTVTVAGITGGWALFLNNADGMSLVYQHPVAPKKWGALADKQWIALRDTMSTGLMTVDEYSKVSFLSKKTLQGASCWSVWDVPTLVPMEHEGLDFPGLSYSNEGATYSYSLYRSELEGCDQRGNDYCIMYVSNQLGSHGTGLYNFCGEWNVFPYDDVSIPAQNRMMYYLR